MMENEGHKRGKIRKKKGRRKEEERKKKGQGKEERHEYSRGTEEG